MPNLDANDESSYFINLSFIDETGEPVAPITAVWTLTDENGKLINDRNQVPIVAPGVEETVVLGGDDLAFSDGQYRVLTLEATYDSINGSGLPLNDDFLFDVRDLVAIPNSGIIVP